MVNVDQDNLFVYTEEHYTFSCNSLTFKSFGQTDCLEVRGRWGKPKANAFITDYIFSMTCKDLESRPKELLYLHSIRTSFYN